MTRDEVLMRVTQLAAAGEMPHTWQRDLKDHGYIVVPIEPTFEMIEEGLCPDDETLTDIYDDSWSAQAAHDDLRARYKAMIDAALAPPERGE